MYFNFYTKVSRFLSEFSDFETNFTPKYRHPPITATSHELNEIGLYEEVKKCNLFMPYNPNIRPEILTEMEGRNIEMPSNRELIREAFLQTISEEVAKNEGEKQSTNIIENGNDPTKLNVSKIRISQMLSKNGEEDAIFLKETSFDSDPNENIHNRNSKYDNLFIHLF